MGWDRDLLIKGFFCFALFCIHPVFVCGDSTKVSQCKLGSLRVSGFVVFLLFCASFICCITEMGWNRDLLIKGFFCFVLYSSCVCLW